MPRFRCTTAEIEALFPLICSRLAVSVVNSAYQRHHFPDNQYLTISERPAWELLERLADVHPRFAHYAFRGACGLEPCPSAPAVVSWLRESAAAIGPLLDPDPRTAPRVVFDFGVGSLTSGTPELWADAGLCARKIARHIEDAGAAIGIGCYDEVRGVYTSPAFSKPGNDGPSARTVHLGLDLFAPPGTPVFAPLDGVVHSVADNAHPLDYGPTIVLEHEADAGRAALLHALRAPGERVVGRAQRRAIACARATRHRADRRASTRTAAGRRTCTSRSSTDLLGRARRLPGRGRSRRARVWLSLAPTRTWSSRIPGGVAAPARPRAAATSSPRAARASGRTSASRTAARSRSCAAGAVPLRRGRPPLPRRRQQRAARRPQPPARRRGGRRQMAVLNTNTRYLHERLVEYAERLCALMPDAAARLLPRLLRQRGQRAGAAAGPRLHRQPRDHRGRRRVPRQHDVARRDQPVQVRRPRRRRRARRTCTWCRCRTSTAASTATPADDAGARYAAHVAAAVERVAERGRAASAPSSRSRS